MTSQKSSLNTFSFTFFGALKEGFLIPLLSTLSMILAVPASTLMTILSFVKASRDPLTGLIDESKKITNLFRFIILDEMLSTSNNILLHLTVIASSIILGIIMFRFIANKKTVNVYYSLGITRENLFISRFLAGALLLFTSVVIPFLISLIINVRYFGFNKELMSAITLYVLGYFVLSMVAFSLTATVFSAVGTVSEGVIFTGVLMLGPTVAYYSAQWFMDKLTLGSPFGHFYSDDRIVTNSLASGLSKYNPLLFLFSNVSRYGFLQLEYVDKKLVFTPPNYTSIIIWAFVASLLFLLGTITFKKRKAEICGFLGENKWLNFIATFLIGFFPMGIAVAASKNISVGILVGTLLFFFLYLVIDFGLIRKFKEWAKGLYKLPIHLGIVFAIVAVFYTGIFGFSSRIPEIDKIESIDITVPGNRSIITPGNPSWNFGEDYTLNGNPGDPITGFKTKADMERIRTLHNLLIKDGRINISGAANEYVTTDDSVYQEVKISYNLNNGKTLKRFYGRVKYDTLLKLLELDSSDRYKELLETNLIVEPKDSDDSVTWESKQYFQSNALSFALYSAKLSTRNDIELYGEQHKALLKALAADLTNQTVEERYFPKEKALGVIRIKRVYADHELIGGPLEEEENSVKTPSIAFREEHVSFGIKDFEGTSFVITPDMKNTIEFLKSNDLYDLLTPEKPENVVAAEIIEVKIARNRYYYASGMTMTFDGGWTKFDNNVINKDQEYYGDFRGVYKTNDKALLEKLEEGAYISYFTQPNGYFVRFTLADKAGFTTMYVPHDKMPAELVKAVNEHKIERPDFGNPYAF